MTDNNQKYQRRVRYQGTHPKSFKEKYKELEPDKYADTITKIIQKGNTPAGTHRPICVNEIMDIFQIKPGQTGLDATLGYGGHALAMLERLDHLGHLYATDADPIEIERTKSRLETLGYGPKEITILNLNFADIDTISTNQTPFDFILADLGVSSMQIDNPDRGFSYKTDGPLDLRMNPNNGIPAEYRLKEMTQDEIEHMLQENSDEPHAGKIAKAIIEEQLKKSTISTTSQLRNIIKDALSFIPKNIRDDEIKKACQRSFQAIRMEVNHELDALFMFLEVVPTLLAKGGKVAIISFHSGEDRLVKKAFQFYARNGVYQEVSPSFIRPQLDEQSSNSRARSAKLRWAIKS